MQVVKLKCRKKMIILHKEDLRMINLMVSKFLLEEGKLTVQMMQ